MKKTDAMKKDDGMKHRMHEARHHGERQQVEEKDEKDKMKSRRQYEARQDAQKLDPPAIHTCPGGYNRFSCSGLHQLLSHQTDCNFLSFQNSGSIFPALRSASYTANGCKGP